MAEKRYGEQYRHLRLCIDSYQDKIFAGRLCQPGQGEEFRFHSLTELLIEADNLFDEARFPQAFTTKRGFVPTTALSLETQAGEGPQNGQKATFLIRILFRQHASWQGTVTWVEGKGEQTFRSVLELVLLMDSALSTREE